jgi:hypothetical protein
MRTRAVAFVALLFLFVLEGCDQRVAFGRAATQPPTEPQPPLAPAQPSSTPNWTADATVISAAHGLVAACGWGTSVGNTRNGVLWRITTTSGAISLDEDMRNWPTDDVPYSGRLADMQFAATYAGASDYADFVCQFREAKISGSFTSDSTFEAEETLFWGPPAAETAVTRHWHGSRL